ncbi:MAG: type II toxin-antitoxin system HicA family toxin [Candidatus Pacebacteria bacterium]|nr:type II toxin-antitoxin system HicA family toxin [Candidatus Paceibacterota bacterium]
MKLPLLSGREVCKALEKLRYEKVRQRGSHIRLKCPGRKSVTVPNYKEVSRALLRKILRDVEISIEEFLKLLE